MNKNIQHIILSRTDNLGDVILSLPVAGYLKKQFPHIKISFIGKTYTRDIIEACSFIDSFIDRAELLNNKINQADALLFLYPDKEVAKIAWKSKITLIVGTTNRWYNWLYCNKKIFFSRKKSDLHEAQLNFKLLEGIDIKYIPSLREIPEWYGFIPKQTDFSTIVEPNQRNIIIHPKSKGSAREWPMEKYVLLTKILIKKEFQVWVTGTAEEGRLIKSEAPEIFDSKTIHDMTGKFNLQQLISFINQADALVACSTGPLHIASALGKLAIGIYPPRRPIHPGRWAALGKKSVILVKNKNCNQCLPSGECPCIATIEAEEIVKLLEEKLQK